MARFMIVTFLLLGWGFFELSGGSDFVPPEVEAKPLNTLMEQVAQEETLVARAAQAPATAEILGEDKQPETSGPVTLASFAEQSTSLPTVLGDAATKLDDPAVTEVSTPRDLRRVSGSRVNMRSGPGTNFQVLATLVQGEETEVLQSPGDGWVQIEVLATGSVGWMAERLLTAPN